MISLRNRIPTWLTLIAGIILIALFAVLISPSPAPAAPTITWAPSQVAETVGQRQHKTKPVSFTSTENLTNVGVSIAPELQPYVSANPSSFSSISAGAAMNLTLTFSAPADAPLQTIEGTLHLTDGGKSNKTYAQPLPITLDIWQSIAEKGILLAYPSLWQRNLRFAAPDQPISLDTFNSKYGQGGVVPEGGAAIIILKLSLSMNEIISQDSVETTIKSTDATLVDDTTATRIIYTIPFEPLFTYSNVVVYVPKGTTLYKFSLLYREGDSREGEFLSSFQQILDTVQFVQ